MPKALMESWYKFHPDGRHPNISLFTVEMNGRQLEYSNAVCVADTLPLTKVKDLKRYYMWDNNWLYDTANADPKSGYNDPIDYDAGIRFAYVYYFDADFQPGLNRVRSDDLVPAPSACMMLQYSSSPPNRSGMILQNALGNIPLSIFLIALCTSSFEADTPRII